MTVNIPGLYFTFLTLGLLFSHPSLAVVQTETTTVVRHYQVQKRYAFGEKVLKLALSKQPGSYRIEAQESQVMNEARGERMVIQGVLDIQWHSTSRHREAKMLPVRIPIYRGILGLRLMLATRAKAPQLAQIKNRDDLRQFTGGHGTHWGDLPVYAANKLTVKTHTNYDALFKLLIDNQFDYFHRGINEIWPEQAQYSKDLQVVKDVMLFYPHPVYFFVTRTKPELANQIQRGLKAAIEDGSFKALFMAEHKAIIEKSNLDSRRLIRLSNPVTPDPSILDTSWWLPVNAAIQHPAKPEHIGKG